MQELSLSNIIFIISSGVLTFVTLFIFAKRQITRFALRSRRGPHVPIGTDAKKSLKKEIERRIEAVPRITTEPRLLSMEPSHYILEPQQPYHYRFRAIDAVKSLEDEIAHQDPELRRHPQESLRKFLKSSLAAPLDGQGQRMVEQFCDIYEYARYHPAEFGEDEFQTYNRLLMKLLDAARLIKNVGGVGRWERSAERGNRGGEARLRVKNTKLPNICHNYTALENLPADSKIEDEIIVVPVRVTVENAPSPVTENTGPPPRPAVGPIVAPLGPPASGPGAAPDETAV